MPFKFAGNTFLQSINAPLVTDFGDVTNTNSQGSYVFYRCSNLTTVNLPLLERVSNGGNQFSKCTALENIFLPKILYTGQSMFSGCTSLKTAVLGVLRTENDAIDNMYGSCFANCSNLTDIDLGRITRIHTNEFSNCSKLVHLILRRSDAISTLGNVNAFTGTPFASGGTGGTIYIPKVLYDKLGSGTSNQDYQSATNWSTIYGYGTITWAKIEGSYYETHYADGTEIGGTS